MSRIDEKIDVAADEIQRELCGCSSRRTRDSGLIVASCVVLVVIGTLGYIAFFCLSRTIPALIEGFGEPVTP